MLSLLLVFDKTEIEMVLFEPGFREAENNVDLLMTNSFIFSRLFSGSGISTLDFPRLLVLHRACLSTLLYKSITFIIDLR